MREILNKYGTGKKLENDSDFGELKTPLRVNLRGDIKA